MSDLAERIGEHDSGDQLGAALALPEYLRDALWRFSSANLDPIESNGLIVCGMGGSAIGGDLAGAALGNRLCKPLDVVRAYGVPPWTSPDRVIFCSSYSGNTEETIGCYAAAEAVGAQRIVATTASGASSISIWPARAMRCTTKRFGRLSACEAGRTGSSMPHSTVTGIASDARSAAGMAPCRSSRVIEAAISANLSTWPGWRAWREGCQSEAALRRSPRRRCGSGSMSPCRRRCRSRRSPAGWGIVPGRSPALPPRHCTSAGNRPSRRPA